MVRSQKTWIAYGLISSAIVLWVGLGALHFRREVERCPPDWVQGPARCCLPGQSETAARCQGAPSSCVPPLSSAPAGCVARAEPVVIQAGTLVLEPTDWDAPASSKRLTIAMAAFQLDPFEVTHERYASCVRAKVCSSLAKDKEISRPVTQISPAAALAFCEFAGGRLPTHSEWLFAASDGGRLRYPWGPHGLTCRRAAFGLTNGPCASSATGPELVGSRPLGARNGLFDLAGNVAEWVSLGPNEFTALGGSFRSTLPAELKSWGRSANQGPPRSEPGQPADDVGFRCAYDASHVRSVPKAPTRTLGNRILEPRSVSPSPSRKTSH